MAGGLGDVPFRLNPLTPFPAREGGKFGGIPPFPLGREARGEINPQNAGEPSAHGGGQRGSRGAEPPWQGVWGMCPQNKERGGE